MMKVIFFATTLVVVGFAAPTVVGVGMYSPYEFLAEKFAKHPNKWCPIEEVNWALRNTQRCLEAMATRNTQKKQAEAFASAPEASAPMHSLSIYGRIEVTFNSCRVDSLPLREALGLEKPKPNIVSIQ